jgi:two-component system response regulator AtoC
MRVLIVDDEENIRQSLGKYFSLDGIDSTGAESAEKALEIFEREGFDAVVLDLKLSGMDGQELLERMAKQGISVPVIMMSAHGEIADAVRALKSGAKDYLVKPFDPAELVIRIRSLVENKKRENIIEAERRTAARETMLIGASLLMRALSDQIDKIAAADVTVLITGESGSGKEAAAREIHNRGPQSAEPFVAVNVGGIHEGLIESELFGHEKGSFTGAVSRKTGLFELAGNGTIFLDEIGEMPQAVQVKLLRVLQDRKIRRLGGVQDIPVRARIISATNQNLEALVKESLFREDLYYRLNVFRIAMPPLRERRDDIPLLADYLLKRRAKRGGPYRLSREALEKLASWSFPGNIRELENILERSVIYCRGNVIEGGDIDLHTAGSLFAAGGAAASAPAAVPESLEEIERQAVIKALADCGGNRTRASVLLGVSRKTILNKIKAYGLT